MLLFAAVVRYNPVEEGLRWEVRSSSCCCNVAPLPRMRSVSAAGAPEPHSADAWPGELDVGSKAWTIILRWSLLSDLMVGPVGLDVHPLNIIKSRHPGGCKFTFLLLFTAVARYNPVEEALS